MENVDAIKWFKSVCDNDKGWVKKMPNYVYKHWYVLYQGKKRKDVHEDFSLVLSKEAFDYGTCISGARFSRQSCKVLSAMMIVGMETCYMGKSLKELFKEEL